MKEAKPVGYRGPLSRLRKQKKLELNWGGKRGGGVFLRKKKVIIKNLSEEREGSESQWPGEDPSSKKQRKTRRKKGETKNLGGRKLKVIAGKNNPLKKRNCKGEAKTTRRLHLSRTGEGWFVMTGFRGGGGGCQFVGRGFESGGKKKKKKQFLRERGGQGGHLGSKARLEKKNPVPPGEREKRQGERMVIGLPGGKKGGAFGGKTPMKPLRKNSLPFKGKVVLFLILQKEDLGQTSLKYLSKKKKEGRG